MSQILIVMLLLSLAVSFDSYFFGLTYSLRSIKVNYTIYLLIGVMTALSFMTGHIIGQSIAFLIPSVTEVLGGIIFVLIGCYIIWQWIDEQRKKIKKYRFHHNTSTLNLRTIWNVLKKPDYADLDFSGTITGKESFFVAIALSLDSFGSGIGSAFTSLPIVFTGIMIGISSSFFLAFGFLTGHWLRSIKWMHQLSFLPGIILICLGFWNFMK
ncbi:sporulation membrane protein YtaF [Bacillaceae bacterium W0354]